MTASVVVLPVIRSERFDHSTLDRTRTALIFALPGVTYPVSLERQILDDDLFFADEVRRDQQ